MSTVQGGDEFLVNRSGATYRQSQSQLMAKLETNDQLLVNRNGGTYRVSGGDFINSVIDPLTFAVTIQPSSPIIGQTLTAVASAQGGKAPDGGWVFTYQWIVADDETGTNASDLAGETSSTYTPINAQADKYLGCRSTTVDYKGTSYTATDYAGPVTSAQIAPSIASVNLTETIDGINRYTDKDFPFTTTMSVEGEPDPEYSLKVKLSGTTFNFDIQSDVINTVEGDGTYDGTDYDNKLTLDSNSYLTDLENKAVKMADADGNSAYTLTTSSITNVDPAPSWVRDDYLSGVVGNSDPTYPALNAFDGNLNTRNLSQLGTVITFNFSSIPCETLRLRTYSANISSSSYSLLKVNDVEEHTKVPTTQQYNWITIWENEENKTLDKIESSMQTGSIYIGVVAIEVDGQILVDNTASGTDPQTNQKLTFADPCTDLQYFRNGDQVGGAYQNVFFTTDASGTFAGLSTIDPSLTTAQAITGSPGSGYCAIDLINGTTDAKITSTITGFLYAYSTDGVTWSGTQSLNSGSAYTDLSVRGVLVNDHGQSVADSARYFLWGGLTDWSRVTIRLEQSLVDATRMGGYTPNSNLQSGGGKIIDIDTAARTMTVDSGSYDTSNQDQQWSSFMTSTDSSGSGYYISSDPVYAFNGVLSNSASTTGANTGDLVITFPNGKRPTVTSKVEVYTNASNTASATLTTTNGTSATVDFDSSTGWTEIQEAGKLGDIETIRISKSATLSAVRVDGQILVDPAITADFSSAGETSGSQTSHAFDGNISTQPYAVSGTVSTYTFANPIKVNQSLRMWIVVSLNNSGFQVNGTFPSSANLPNSSNSQGQWYNFTNHVGIGNNLESITWTYTSGTRFTSPALIEVDGKLLLDGSLRDFGVNKITLPSNGGLGTLVKTNAEAAYIDNTGSSLNRWIGPNQGNKDFRIVPVTPIQESTTTAWGVVEQTGGTIEVKSVVGSEPEFELLTAKDGTIEFPATFTTTGNPPDTDLPVGTAIQAIIKASNAAGSNEATSTPALIPADPNPGGAVGPITDSTATTITSANTANIDTLTASDKLIMVDSTGTKATYQLETPTIETISTLDFRVGYPQPANLGTNNAASAQIAISAMDIGNVEFRTREPGDDWAFGSTGTNPGWQQFLIIDQGSPRVPFLKFNQNMTGASYSIWVSETGTGSSWEFDATIEPVGTENIYTTKTARYYLLVRNANGDSTGANTLSSIPGMSVAPIYFITPDEVGGTVLEFTGTLADNKDLKFFKTDDILQRDPNFLSGDWVSMTEVKGSLGAYGSWNNVFNGVIGTTGAETDFISPKGSGAENECVFTIDPPIEVKNNVNIIGLQEYEGSVRLNESFLCPAANVAYGNENIIEASSISGSLSKVTVSRSGTGAYLSAIKVDGRLLIDPSVATSTSYNDVKVISVGTSDSPQTNTMVVSGGSWDTSNKSQLWSANVTNESASGGYEYDHVFDGNSTTYYTRNNTGDSVSTFTGFDSITSLAILGSRYNAGGAGGGSIIVNAGQSDEVDITSQIPLGTNPPSGAAVETAITGVSSLKTLTINGTNSGNGSFIAGIKVDGNLLVDKLYDSEDWSSTEFCTAGASGNNQYSSDRAFSGELAGEQVWYPPVGTTAVFETGTQFNNASSIEFVYTRAGTADFSLNGTPLNLPVGIDQTHTAVLPSGFQKLEFNYPGTSNYCALAWIKIDGVLLQDAGIRDLGDNKVTFTPPSGTATFNTAVGQILTVTGSNDRWISNDNRLSKDFYAKKDLGRGLDANNPADVQIYQDIVDAFAAFPVKVNQRRTGIASILFRLINGDAVSVAESELLEDVVLDAVNAQEPLALNGYYPLFYTADAANAASSTGTHHVHTIDGTDYYMPDGGTIYHGNYIS